MNTNATPTTKLDTRVLLSTLWIVVMFNMLKYEHPAQVLAQKAKTHLPRNGDKANSWLRPS